MVTNNTKALMERSSPSATDNANQTSHSLIVRVKGKDAEAWDRLVELYSPLVYFWCQKSGLPQADLRDVFQDVFFTLARNIEKFQPLENGTFRGWLRTVTRNRVTDYVRKLGRDPRPAGGTEALRYLEQVPATEPPVENHELGSSQESEIQHTLLRKALENIRESFAKQTWTAFWMVVVEGRETIDVAKDLSMRPGTVRVAKSRVLKRLRLEIGDSVD